LTLQDTVARDRGAVIPVGARRVLSIVPSS